MKLTILVAVDQLVTHTVNCCRPQNSQKYMRLFDSINKNIENLVYYINCIGKALFSKHNSHFVTCNFLRVSPKDLYT